MDALTNQRVEGAADRQRHVESVGVVAEGHTHQGVHGPAGHAVVEERVDDGVLRSLARLPRPDWWRVVLRHRLGDGEEHEVHSNAGGEEHRGPGEQTILGPGVIGAEADRPCPRERDPQHEDHTDRGGEDVEPAEVIGDPPSGGAQGVVGVIGSDGRPGHDDRDPQSREEEHRPVGLGLHDLARGVRLGFPLVAVAYDNLGNDLRFSGRVGAFFGRVDGARGARRAFRHFVPFR